MLEIFVSDVHFPQHCKKSWSLFLKAVKSINPDMVWLGGDMYDFYAASRFPKDPRRALNLQDEIHQGNVEVAKLRRTLPNAKIYQKVGNHEARLEKYLDSKAPELRYLDSLSLPSLLKVKELDLTYVASLERKKFGHLWHLHGHELRVNASVVNIARTYFLKLNVNAVLGHWHRLQSYVHRSYDGSYKGVWANGCMQDFEQVEYDGAVNWQKSFLIIDYSKSGLFNVDPVLFIERGKEVYCRVWGKEFSSAEPEKPVKAKAKAKK